MQVQRTVWPFWRRLLKNYYMRDLGVFQNSRGSFLGFCVPTTSMGFKGRELLALLNLMRDQGMQRSQVWLSHFESNMRHTSNSYFLSCKGFEREGTRQTLASPLTSCRASQTPRTPAPQPRFQTMSKGIYEAFQLFITNAPPP